VIWDEDIALKNEYLAKWSQLSSQDKENAVNSLKGYSMEKESQLIEEWAVREMEKNLSN
jgi:hypothetical protein